MMFLKLLIIASVVVLTIDLSGFVKSLKSFISLKLTKGKIDSNSFSIKPFDCSYCMTFWCGLLYTIVSGEFTLVNLLWVCLIPFFTDVIRQSLLLIKDTLNKLIDKYYELLIDKTR